MKHLIKNIRNHLILAMALLLGVNAFAGEFVDKSLTTTKTEGHLNIVEKVSSVTITSVSSTDPTDCGLADGTITITATSSTGSPIEYSIDSGQTWIPSNMFPALAGGNYCPAAREVPNGNIVYASCLNLNDKIPPVHNTTTSISPSTCSLSDGAITISATGQGGLQYSIDNGVTFQNNNTFTGLPCGTYSICIRNSDGTCLICAPDVVLTASVQPNIITDSIAIGAVHTICVPTGNLSGTPISTTISCNNLQNTIVDSIVGTCLHLYADDYGYDTTCVVICDNFGVCDTTQLIIYVEDGVWPGDTDDNTIVNNNDLLTLGLGFGNSGTPRSTFSNIWNGFITQKWNVSTPISNVDYRHIDCNGDGTINADDTLAIVQNWAKYYFKSGNGGGGNGVPIYVGAINNTTSNYPHYQAPIMIGDPSNQANNLYGAAFTITYDTTYIVNNSVYITFDNSWVGTKDVDMLGLERNFPNDGDIEAAFTKIDGVNVNGFGSIGSLKFTIKDDIFQRTAGINTDSIVLSFEIIDVKMIENDETDIPANPQQANITITSSKQVDLSKYVNVFPNPATTILYIQTNHLQVNHMSLTDVTGRIVYTETVTPKANYKLDIQSLPKGIYNLQMQTDEGIATKRIVVID